MSQADERRAARLAAVQALYQMEMSGQGAEEVGVQIRNTRYFASQSWPFPHSLMIAFVCEWAGGEIAPQAGEIEDAKWFALLQLPKLPSRISIARRLIDAVIDEIKSKRT